jgi:hypothetical protein
MYYSSHVKSHTKSNFFYDFWPHYCSHRTSEQKYSKLRLQSESYVTTDGQSASLSCNKAPMWGLRPDFYYCQTVAGMLMWSPLSDERMGLSFVYAASPCQRSLSRVQVTCDSRPYFTVSDLRLPFSSPPMTRRATVEVFDPASTRDNLQTIFRVCYKFSVRTTQKIQLTLLLRDACVGICLPSCCLIMLWSNLLQYYIEVLCCF